MSEVDDAIHGDATRELMDGAIGKVRGASGYRGEPL
jgi:hypothetical protein